MGTCDPKKARREGESTLTEDLVDSGHQFVAGFSRELRGLESAESYRTFVLRYFSGLRKKELLLSLITMAEMNDPTLLRSPEFQTYFTWVSHREFAKLLSGFSDERIRLGFGL
jgi:hypothetical protein